MSDDDSIVCYVCNAPEENPNLAIECVQCCRSAHFSCLKISGSAIKKAKKKNYYCSSACSEIYSRNANKPAGGYDLMLSEIQKLSVAVHEVKEDTARTNYVLAQTREDMNAIIRTTTKIEESQSFLSAKFDQMKIELDDFNHELATMRRDHEEVRKDVGDFSDRQRYLEEKVDHLEIELDKLQRESLSRNAVIMGIPYTENENSMDLVAKIVALVKLVLQDGDIVGARRLRAKSGPSVTGPIIVTFRTSQIKENLFECKRTHGVLMASSICSAFNTSTNKIAIRDEMTTFGKQLLERAKEVQVQLGFKYVWFGRNGKVLLRRQDGAKVEEISSMKQLYALTKTQKRVHNSSSASITSPDLGPSPKRR